MKFTFKEWQKIRHALTVAQGQYKKHLHESKPSDDHLSHYQIFKRQTEEVSTFISRIDNAEV